MTSHNSETAGGEDRGFRSKARQVISTVEKPRRDGSLATLAGSAMLAWTAKTMWKNTSRAALQALAGVALLGIGRRQRQARRREDRVETGEDVRRTEEGTKVVSDEAHAEAAQDLGAQRNADESQSVYQSETEPNPRGMSDRSEVQRDDGGDVDFVQGKDPGKHRETHLEDEHDTRHRSESDDESTEVDLSEVSMADEASEAAGPHPEQAYPAREGTDPEPISDEAPPRISEETESSAGPDTEDDRVDDEYREQSDESEETT